MRFVYTLVLWLLLPLVFVRLALRARKQPEYWQHLDERFGFYPVRSDKPVIWLHAVSVGETRATVSLVAKLRAAYPDYQIVLTHTTPTGRATSEQLYGDGVLRVYLPYDYPFAVRRFLRHFRPKLGILMETEIWFNLIHAGYAECVPMLLLNARLSEKSARGYARVASLTRCALQELDAIAAQTADDAARLTRLGAQQISVMGNLKFDIAPPPAMLELGSSLRQQFGTARQVFLAASTREGEEALLLDAWQSQDCLDGVLLVIVPRHPQRFAEIADMIGKRGLRYQRRSENREVPAEVQVVLGDSMGEMFAYYAAADLAFIGGSLLPFGGQNLIEACSVGTPVLIGPHTYNFADATRLAVEASAAVQVGDAAELILVAQRLLNDSGAMAAMRKQGVQFVAAHQGATDKAMAVIGKVLSSRGSPAKKERAKPAQTLR
ncbi:MAG TPA: lipid IV(A) 3-deoxy-D-manno-octulosonic acid transferase [Gallionella sp.]